VVHHALSFKNVTRNIDTLPKANWFRQSCVCLLVLKAFPWIRNGKVNLSV
jgi:hypothetical protein